jgi:hypothetical protein
MLYEDYATMDPAIIVKLSFLISKPSSQTAESATFHATLGEIDVTNICRDNDTFRTIKDRYLEVRGFRARARRLFLFQPYSVHFVKVRLFNACL